MNLIFIHGRGSSGKDTQAHRIIETTPNSFLVSPGDIFRQARNPESPYRKYYPKFARYIPQIDNGQIVPEAITMEIVEDVIKEQISKGVENFVFTGFPRTEEQLTMVDYYIKDLEFEHDEKINVKHVVYAVTESESRRRAEARRNSTAEARPDDDPNKVENRLRVYKEKVAPMLHKLAERGDLIVIKSSGSIENVRRRTEEKFDTSFAHPERR